MFSDRCRKAFTLIEVLIVVVIMAVLAATIIPQFSSSTQDARESSLNFNLHTLRSQIELYKVHHLGSYPAITANGLPQLTSATNVGGTAGTPGDDYPFGPYLDGDLPANPLNGLNTVVAGTGSAGSDSYGWQYDVATGRIWGDHDGANPAPAP